MYFTIFFTYYEGIFKLTVYYLFLQMREKIPEYGTYRTLVNHLLEGLADIEEGKVQDFQEAMKEIRKELEI